MEEFYRLKFWDEICGDQVQSREVAAELFDTAVNMGPQMAVLFLQPALNLLTRNGKSYTDLVEDGRMGPRTLHALGICLACDPEEMLLLWMNVYQGGRYAALMKKSPDQEAFARGWAKRVRMEKV